MRVFVTGLALLTLAVMGLSAQESAAPAAYDLIIGPRLGITYVFTSARDFTAAINERRDERGSYVPLMSVFGVAAEQRLLLGETTSHFAAQELLLLSGMEQSLALLSGSLLMGYRDATGFEAGFGPTMSPTGMGVVIAAGWTITYCGVYIPIDLSLVLPNKQRPANIALTTGFNFVIKSVN